MNTEEHIDKLFREGLHSGQKEPPPHLWSNISDTLKVTPAPQNGQGKPGRKLLWWFGSVLIIGLISTGVLLLILSDESVSDRGSLTHQKTGYHHNGGDDDILIASAEINSTHHQKISKESPVITSSEKIRKAADKSVSDHNVKTAYSHDDLMIPATKSERATEVITQHPEQEPALPEPKEKPIEAVAELTMDITVEAADEAVEEEAETPAERPADVKEEEIAEGDEEQQPDISRKLQKPLAREMMYGIALHGGSQLYRAVAPYPSTLGFSPEGTIYGSMHFKRFNMKIGAGVSCHTDRNRWETTVLKLDTVAYYQRVTGVTFIPVYDPTDSTIIGYIPGNITTTNYPIIDSSQETISHDIRNRYTFFSVPVIAGYDIYHSSRLTLGVQAGMIYYRRVYEKRPLPGIAQEKVIFAMDDLGLVRREHFWQYQAGLYGRYDINLKWYAEGAVSVRRPVGSWYEQGSVNGKPTSLVFSAGFGFWL